MAPARQVGGQSCTADVDKEIQTHTCAPPPHTQWLPPGVLWGDAPAMPCHACRTNQDKYVQAARLRIRELETHLKMSKKEVRRSLHASPLEPDPVLAGASVHALWSLSAAVLACMHVGPAEPQSSAQRPSEWQLELVAWSPDSMPLTCS